MRATRSEAPPAAARQPPRPAPGTHRPTLPPAPPCLRQRACQQHVQGSGRQPPAAAAVAGHARCGSSGRERGRAGGGCGPATGAHGEQCQPAATHPSCPWPRPRPLQLGGDQAVFHGAIPPDGQVQREGGCSAQQLLLAGGRTTAATPVLAATRAGRGSVCSCACVPAPAPWCWEPGIWGNGGPHTCRVDLTPPPPQTW